MEKCPLAQTWAEICHANQGSLRERQVQKRSAYGKSCAQANLLDQKEGSDCPQVVERQDKGEYLTEFFAQALVVEAYGRHQVATQGNAHAGGHHHRDGESGCSP